MSEKYLILENNETSSMDTPGQSFTDCIEHKSGEDSTFDGNTEDTTRPRTDEGFTSDLSFEDLAKYEISEHDSNSFQSQDVETSTLSAEFKIFQKEVGKAYEVMEDRDVDSEEIFVKKNFVKEMKDSETKLRIAHLRRGTSLLPISDTSRTLTESEDHTDLENSPIRNRAKKIEYNSNNIQQILFTGTGIKIEVILEFATAGQRQNQKHKLATDKLIGKIQEYIITQNKNEQNYLVIDCISSSLVNTAYLAKLYYRNKHPFWKLDIRPLVNYYHVVNQEWAHLFRKLDDVKLDVCGITMYYDTNIKSARLEQIIEYAKLIKDYPILNCCNFQKYKAELIYIYSLPPSSYVEQHCEESRPNTKSLSPPQLSRNSNADMPESVELSKGSGMITRSRARASRDLNNPQRSTSGRQMQGQKRV